MPYLNKSDKRHVKKEYVKVGHLRQVKNPFKDEIHKAGLKQLTLRVQKEGQYDLNKAGY